MINCETTFKNYFTALVKKHPFWYHSNVCTLLFLLQETIIKMEESIAANWILKCGDSHWIFGWSYLKILCQCGTKALVQIYTYKFIAAKIQFVCSWVWEGSCVRLCKSRRWRLLNIERLMLCGKGSHPAAVVSWAFSSLFCLFSYVSREARLYQLSLFKCTF